MKFHKNSDGIIIDVHVKPNSKQFRIAVELDELVVFCRETPVKGRVNRELITELSRLFKRRVEILSGFSSRQKQVWIRGIEAKEAKQVLDVAVSSKVR